MSPARHKERTTVVAVHNAFKEDERKLPKDLVPYHHTLGIGRFLNLYDLELHRDAPEKFRELRRLWGMDEEEYMREVRRQPPILQSG